MTVSDLVILASAGIILAAVGLVGIVAILDQGLPRRDFDIVRLLASVEASEKKGRRR